MKERPIIMSGPMVNAILEGRKTQTRRVIKPQPSEGYRWSDADKLFLLPGSRLGLMWRCPHGAPGDRLWVRETFVLEHAYDEGDLPADRPVMYNDQFEFWQVPHYRATEPEPHIVPFDLVDTYDDRTRWSPSIFMPRWASRLLLEVTGVRAERLQEISYMDAKAEGVETLDLYHDELDFISAVGGGTGRLGKIVFAKLWDSLNEKRGFPWERNPWVWVVEFKALDTQ
jgi:hypothetical protein